MSGQTVILVDDTPSSFSERIIALASAQSIMYERMTSNEFAARITICRSDASLRIFPEASAIILSTTYAEPQSFDEEFLAQEKETVIRAWAMLNSCKILSCVDIENNDLSAGKTSCSGVEKEFGISCRREIFSLRLPPPSVENTDMWLRDGFSQVMVPTQMRPTTSAHVGPFWGRGALKSGHYAVFLVIDDWCKHISGSHSEASLAALTSKIASRLCMSIGCFTWWREHESNALFLAKIERFPPDNLSKEILDEAILQIFQVLSL